MSHVQLGLSASSQSDQVYLAAWQHALQSFAAAALVAQISVLGLVGSAQVQWVSKLKLLTAMPCSAQQSLQLLTVVGLPSSTMAKQDSMSMLLGGSTSSQRSSRLSAWLPFPSPSQPPTRASNRSHSNLQGPNCMSVSIPVPAE